LLDLRAARNSKMADDTSRHLSLGEVELGDTLSETTRKERKALLGVSLAAMVIAKTGLIPSKIENLGIEFSSQDRATLLYLIVVAVVYFLTAFVIYAWSDFVRWRLSIHRTTLGLRESSVAEETVSDDRWVPLGDGGIFGQTSPEYEERRLESERRERKVKLRDEYARRTKWVVRVRPLHLALEQYGTLFCR
jgi:hypothetical protein